MHRFEVQNPTLTFYRNIWAEAPTSLAAAAPPAACSNRLTAALFPLNPPSLILSFAPPLPQVEPPTREIHGRLESSSREAPKVGQVGCCSEMGRVDEVLGCKWSVWPSGGRSFTVPPANGTLVFSLTLEKVSKHSV